MIGRSYKNDEFDWPFVLVVVTRKNNLNDRENANNMRNATGAGTQTSNECPLIPLRLSRKRGDNGYRVSGIENTGMKNAGNHGKRG